MPHGRPGVKGKHRKTKTTRKYGRNKRPLRYPLMPDGLTVEQAWEWQQKYEVRD